MPGKPLFLRRALDRGFNKRTARLKFQRANHMSPVPVKATLTTALTGTNNDLTFTAVQAGADGNQITVAYVNAGASKPLAVTFTWNEGPARAISVQLATDGSSVITSTAAQVAAAINAHYPTQNHVQAANAAGNDGTGLVTAMSATALSGGTG